MGVTFILTFVLEHTFMQRIFSIYCIDNLIITVYLLALGNC